MENPDNNEMQRAKRLLEEIDAAEEAERAKRARVDPEPAGAPDPMIETYDVPEDEIVERLFVETFRADVAHNLPHLTHCLHVAVREQLAAAPAMRAIVNDIESPLLFPYLEGIRGIRNELIARVICSLHDIDKQEHAALIAALVRVLFGHGMYGMFAPRVQWLTMLIGQKWLPRDLCHIAVEIALLLFEVIYVHDNAQRQEEVHDLLAALPAAVLLDVMVLRPGSVRALLHASPVRDTLEPRWAPISAHAERLFFWRVAAKDILDVLTRKGLLKHYQASAVLWAYERERVGAWRETDTGFVYEPQVTSGLMAAKMGMGKVCFMSKRRSGFVLYDFVWCLDPLGAGARPHGPARVPPHARRGAAECDQRVGQRGAPGLWRFAGPGRVQERHE